MSTSLTLFRQESDGSLTQLKLALEGGCILKSIEETKVETTLPLFMLLGESFTVTRNREITEMQDGLRMYTHEAYMAHRGYSTERNGNNTTHRPKSRDTASADLIILNAFDARAQVTTPKAAEVRAKFDTEVDEVIAATGECADCVRNPIIRRHYYAMQAALIEDGVLVAPEKK